MDVDALDLDLDEEPRISVEHNRSHSRQQASLLHAPCVRTGTAQPAQGAQRRDAVPYAPASTSHTIPGPAGLLLSSLQQGLLPDSLDDLSPYEATHHSTLLRAHDVDFISAAWLGACDQVGVGCKFEDVDRVPGLQSAQLIMCGSQCTSERLLLIVDALTPSASGSTFVCLKDPTGKLKGAMTADVFTKHPAVERGSVVLLQGVPFLRPINGHGYACISPAHVVRVIPRSDAGAVLSLPQPSRPAHPASTQPCDPSARSAVETARSSSLVASVDTMPSVLACGDAVNTTSSTLLGLASPQTCRAHAAAENVVARSHLRDAHAGLEHRGQQALLRGGQDAAGALCRGAVDNVFGSGGPSGSGQGRGALPAGSHPQSDTCFASHHDAPLPRRDGVPVSGPPHLAASSAARGRDPEFAAAPTASSRGAAASALPPTGQPNGSSHSRPGVQAWPLTAGETRAGFGAGTARPAGQPSQSTASVRPPQGRGDASIAGDGRALPATPSQSATQPNSACHSTDARPSASDGLDRHRHHHHQQQQQLQGALQSARPLGGHSGEPDNFQLSGGRRPLKMARTDTRASLDAAGAGAQHMRPIQQQSNVPAGATALRATGADGVAARPPHHSVYAGDAAQANAAGMPSSVGAAAHGPHPPTTAPEVRKPQPWRDSLRRMIGQQAAALPAGAHPAAVPCADAPEPRGAQDDVPLAVRLAAARQPQRQAAPSGRLAAEGCAHAAPGPGFAPGPQRMPNCQPTPAHSLQPQHRVDLETERHTSGARAVAAANAAIGDAVPRLLQRDAVLPAARSLVSTQAVGAPGDSSTSRLLKRFGRTPLSPVMEPQGMERGGEHTRAAAVPADQCSQETEPSQVRAAQRRPVLLRATRAMPRSSQPLSSVLAEHRATCGINDALEHQVLAAAGLEHDSQDSPVLASTQNIRVSSFFA